MSDFLADDDLETDRAPAKEPSKRWRNRYRSLLGEFHINHDDGTIETKPAGEWWGNTVFPSREIAEQDALEFLRAMAFYEAAPDYPGKTKDEVTDNQPPIGPYERPTSKLVAYLGAFPVDGDCQ